MRNYQVKMTNLLSKTALFATVAIGLGSLFAAPAQAQTVLNPLLPTQGTREISLDGRFQFDPVTDVNLNLGYGYFLNRNLEVGGRFSFSDTDGAPSSYGLVGFADYHFPSESALLPFVGVQVGFADPGGDNDTSFLYGVRGGVKYFLNQNVSVNGILEYNDTDSKNADSTFALNLGLSVYLR